MRTDGPPRIAIVDGASFVLPYDHGLIGGLVRRGWRVTLFASETRYNADCLDVMPPGVEVRRFAVSSTAAPRWRGAWNYLRMWRQVWRRRAEFDAVNLQFSILWPVELLFAALLRRRFVLTLHNAVPHGFAGPGHRPTAWLIRLAARVVFVSDATRRDAEGRYGTIAHAAVLPHGLLPPAPGEAPRPYAEPPVPQALVFWGNVAPYKGVDLLLEMASVPGLPPLEVQGAFDPALRPLREDLAAAGVTVVDRFLSAAELRTLFARPVVFLLPYRRATQSGALYTLLHQGCWFLCSDSGELGDFMRRHSLHDLLLADRSAAAVRAALDLLQVNPARWAAAFAAAQRAAGWDAALVGAEAAYGLRQSAR